MCDVKNCRNVDVELTYKVFGDFRNVCNVHFCRHCDNKDDFSLKDPVNWPKGFDKNGDDPE